MGWLGVGGAGGAVDVCIYKNIAGDKSSSIMTIVPDIAVSTSVRTQAGATYEIICPQ